MIGGNRRDKNSCTASGVLALAVSRAMAARVSAAGAATTSGASRKNT